MTPPRYPLFLDLAGRRVLVVGGGRVAARRTPGLLDSGALVTLVAPELHEDLADRLNGPADRLEHGGSRLEHGGSRLEHGSSRLEDGSDPAEDHLAWVRRRYVPADLDGVWLVLTATGNREVDDGVAADCERARVWCVRADEASASAAWTPAVARVADVSVAVSAGGDPGRAVRLRNAVASALQSGTLPLRRTRPGPGAVALVGGGPGDPGLITTRGRQLLAAAEVVVVDRLAPLSLIEDLDEDVVVIDVGKAPDHHPVPQEEINRLLVEHARAGRRVVRLKGGDPYVLGRGREELDACRAAGVDVEVVPGVTSAIAVPAAAGIPVTHRGLSRAVVIATAHDGLELAGLASLDATLVLLMGVTRLAATAEALIASGKSPDVPAAVIESGFSPRQRTTTGTLATIAGIARERRVRSPAVVVVGAVAALAEGAGPG